MTIPGKQAMFEKVVLKLGCRTLTLWRGVGTVFQAEGTAFVMTLWQEVAWWKKGMCLELRKLKGHRMQEDAEIIIPEN